MSPVMSRIRLCMVFGVILCFLLYATCMARRRFVSPIARSIEPVVLSAYKSTRPFTLRAALPMVWMSDVSLRRNPSLSASNMPTSSTSGRSRPSRKRLTPTKTSNTPLRKSVSISMRSIVLTSLWTYRAFTLRSTKNCVRSSAIFLVRTVTKERAPRCVTVSASRMKSFT